MPFHAFFGVAVMMSKALITTTFANPPAAWGVNPSSDQATGGALAWAFGELPTLIVLLVLFLQWSKSDGREARRTDRYEAPAYLARYQQRRDAGQAGARHSGTPPAGNGAGSDGGSADEAVPLYLRRLKRPARCRFELGDHVRKDQVWIEPVRIVDEHWRRQRWNSCTHQLILSSRSARPG